MERPTFDEFLARLRAQDAPAPHPRYGAYRSYRGVFEAVLALRARGAAVEMFGRSAGGEPLWAVRVGGDVGEPDHAAAPRRRVLYVANLHAQEFVGVETALRVLGAALDRMAARDPLLEGVEITCVPTANPDGYRRVAAEAARGRPGFARKNAHGVDLNRNFSEGHDPRALLTRLLPFLYEPGAAPLSEPETAALDVLFARRFQRALSLHSFGRYLFWPWAGRSRPTVDDARFAALAERMRARARTPYRALQLGRWARWFRAGGAEIDHLYGRYGTLAFLLEIGDGGRDLSSPGTWLDPFSWFNPRDVEQVAGEAAAIALALAERPWDSEPIKR